MAYSNYTLSDLREKFGIDNKQEESLFHNIKPIEPSAWLKDTLKKAKHLPVRSEKARSEAIVFPMLTELTEYNQHRIIFYSGENLDADKKNKLNGECDFIVSKNIGSYTLNIPIFALVEAKKNDFDEGIPQCAAQMLGARLYNQKMKQPIEVIYGCVTTAEQWLFLKLEGNTFYIDTEKYGLQTPDIILGVLQHIVEISH
jgi:hypothetical protein